MVTWGRQIRVSEEKTNIFRLQNHHCDLTKFKPGCLNSWPHHCYNFVSFPTHLSSKLIHKQTCPCLQPHHYNCSGNSYSISRKWRCMISIIKHLSRASSQHSAKKEMSHLKCKWASSPQTDEDKTPGVESFHSSLSSTGESDNLSRHSTFKMAPAGSLFPDNFILWSN